MVTPIYNFDPAQASDLDRTLTSAASFFILCVGFDEEQAKGFTCAYKREFSTNWVSLQKVTCRVSSTVIVFVDRFNFDEALKSLHYIPAVIVLNEGVFYSKITKRYVRKLCVPLVRVTAEPTAVSALGKDDYYYGVCATIVNEELSNSDVVCPTLDYALLVSIRLNTDVIHRVQEQRDANGTQEMKAVKPEGSATTAIPLAAVLDEPKGIESSTDLEAITVPQARAALYKHAQEKAPAVVRALGVVLVLSSLVL